MEEGESIRSVEYLLDLVVLQAVCDYEQGVICEVNLLQGQFWYSDTTTIECGSKYVAQMPREFHRNLAMSLYVGCSKMNIDAADDPQYLDAYAHSSLFQGTIEFLDTGICNPTMLDADIHVSVARDTDTGPDTQVSIFFTGAANVGYFYGVSATASTSLACLIFSELRRTIISMSPEFFIGIGAPLPVRQKGLRPKTRAGT